MGKRSFRYFVTAAVFWASALLLACEMGHLRLVIPDFESSDVKGVQLYRVDDATGALVDAGHIEFMGIELNADRGEEMMFRQYEVDGTPGFGPFYAPVVRDPAQPDAIELYLTFLNELPSGWFKVASYNLIGMSRPSTAQSFVEGKPS